LTLSGTGKWAVGSFTTLDVQGSPTSPFIIGNAVTVTSNGTTPVTSSTIYGQYVSLDLGFPATEAIAAYISAVSGGSGATGTVLQTGLQVDNLVAHNGDLTTGYAGDFHLVTAVGSASAVATTAALRARYTVRSNVDITSAVGLLIGDWAYAGSGNTKIANSYALKIDTSMDVGTVSKYAIYSTSLSQSLLSAPLKIATAAESGVVGALRVEFDGWDGAAYTAGLVVKSTDAAAGFAPFHLRLENGVTSTALKVAWSGQYTAFSTDTSTASFFFGNNSVFPVEFNVGTAQYAMMVNPDATNRVGIRVKMQASPTVDAMQIRSSADADLLVVDKNGTLGIKVNAAPADADIDANQLFFWFDSSNGAAKVKFKGKSANATVVAGEVALA
jgi:hypothetical protein